ncbi:radical SAM family heme chaperone HemW [Peribacillus tepidiphilus]|uniref:radical SAM family heme chaperone HemW n=1 Tax=Peribacillus tepidiphilus TaxID=2652445 RepID=UPI0035B51CAD
MIRSAYIHIPFCEHICHYCDFNKMFLKGQPVDEYLFALEKEMQLALKMNPTDQLHTIFVGGGTPTSLNESQLKLLCTMIEKNLPYQNDVEFTFEANPGDLSIEKLKILHTYGVNRISFGVQSFNEELLKKIGRTHKPSDVYDSIENAQKAGFHNISIDLIYGLPGQTLEDFHITLQKALEIGLPHYSGYSLIVEPKTVFYNLMQKGKLNLPPQEIEAQMYELLMEKMDQHGLHQYEISNFAKKDFESKHNLTYWNNEEYYGFGAGAHGYVNGMRVANYGPLKKYMEPISLGNLPYIEKHKVSDMERMEEEIFLGLRKTSGVELAAFEKKFGQSLTELFKEQMIDLTKRGLITIDNGSLKLTHKGKLLGNEVFGSFIGVI